MQLKAKNTCCLPVSHDLLKRDTVLCSLCGLCSNRSTKLKFYVMTAPSALVAVSRIFSGGYGYLYGQKKSNDLKMYIRMWVTSQVLGGCVGWSNRLQIFFGKFFGAPPLHPPPGMTPPPLTANKNRDHTPHHSRKKITFWHSLTWDKLETKYSLWSEQFRRMWSVGYTLPRNFCSG